MSKYYTPTIEEFHEDFECEFQGVDCNWRLTGWDKETVVITPKEKKVGVWQLDFDVINSVYHEGDVSNTLRVKYLDREDIKSLGFVSKRPSSNMRYYHYFKKDAPGSLGYWTEVLIDFRWGWDDISIIGVRGDEEGIIFKGSIKNKSELKRILKQLNIK